MRLKNCPFCEGTTFILNKRPKDKEESVKYWVYCHECGLNGPKLVNEVDAINLWNRLIIIPKRKEEND